MSIYRQGPAPANTCPRCRESLVKVETAEGVSSCEKCGGVFADVAATQRIVSTMDRALLEIGFQAALGKERKKHEPRELTCPECLITMQMQRIESAACTVDVCPLHGTWFDTGELEDVMRAFNRARRHGARAPGLVPEAHSPSIAVVQRSSVPPPESLLDFVKSFFV
jgi:Zn-finger nucleic acid-binding protein